MHRWLTLLIILLLSACAAHSNPARGLPLAGLPELSSLPGALVRTASATLVRSGESVFSSGGEITLSGGTAQFSTASGVLSWAIYQFDTTSSDVVEQLTIDVSGLNGQVWFAISDYGAQRWEFSSSLNEAIVHSLPPAGNYSSPGHTYVALVAHGGAGFTIESVALDLAGPALAFARSIGLEGWNETLEFAQTDPDGNLFAAGTFSDGTVFDTQIVKFAPDGSAAWRYRYSLDEHLTPHGMVSDGSGGMYLLLRYDFSPNPPLTVMRINSVGNVLWATHYSNGNGDHFQGNSLASDGAGGLLISGSIIPSGDDGEGLLMRLSADGFQIFTITWEDVLSGGVSGLFAFVNGGEIYHSGGDFDTAYLHKFALDGNPGWARQWPVSTVSYAPNLAADAGGGILVGGSMSDGINNVTDFSIIDFDAQGNVDTQFGYRTPFAFSFFSGILNASDGSLLLGVFNGEQFSEMGLVRLGLDGTLLSQQRLIDGTGSPSPFVLGSQAVLAEGPAGRVYLVGHTDGPGTASLAARTGEAITPSLAPVGGTFTYQPISLSESTIFVLSQDIMGDPDPSPSDPDGLIAAIDL